MRSVAVALALVACSNDLPPPIGDSDGGSHNYADAYTPPVPTDAGADAGTAYDLDFYGVCMSGYVPVWHFFDFQTHTPGTSALDFAARSAATQAALASAPSVHFATVAGADITVWTGVDIDPMLQSINQMSYTYLRIVVTETPAGDGTPPVLEHYRQAFDCVIGQ
jgi:hypothetical protein